MHKDSAAQRRIAKSSKINESRMRKMNIRHQYSFHKLEISKISSKRLSKNWSEIFAPMKPDTKLFSNSSFSKD